MPPFLALLGALKWPATVAGAIVVFGVSSQGTLSLISEQTRNLPVAHAKTQMPAPVIKVAPVVVAPRAAAEKKIADLAPPSTPTAVDSGGIASMVATTGLVVRTKPMKASAQMGSVAAGEVVEVRSKQGSWLLIATKAGTTGWVFGKYLKLVGANERG